MTALILDGFDHYGSGPNSINQLLAGPYAASSSVTCGAPPWGTAATGLGCLVHPGDAGSYIRRVLPTPGSHFLLSFRWATDAITPGLPPPITFSDGSNNPLFYLLVTSTGVIELVAGNGTVIAQTAGPVCVAHNWHFFEMEVNTTSGLFTLRVDDAQGSNTPILTTTSASVAGTIAQFTLLGGPPITAPGCQSYIDDLFVRDTNGTVNNGWLGDRRIATLFPDADSTPMGWSPNYYKEFGAGILTLSYMLAANSTPQNQTAMVEALAASALDIGNSDFTLETFVRFDVLPLSGNYSSIFNRWDIAHNGRSYRLILGSQAFNNGCLQFDTSTDGTAATVQTKILYPWTPTTNTWHHLALVRAAGELLLFVDGVQLGLPIADSQTYYSGGGEPFSLGLEGQGGSPGYVTNTYLCGRLDETRFTNGVGRYTGPFTVPTAAFPRGIADPDWAQVVLLMGYDSGIIDESSYNRTIQVLNGAAATQPTDGPAVGVYSTINKVTPDDNSFIQAALLNASNIFTMTTQPANGDTVTVGTKDGTHAAVYTFKTAISTAFDVLIDTTAQNTLMNLLNAINNGAGSGTKYGSGTTSNYDVQAVQLPAGQFEVVANVAGTGGNSIASTATGSAAHWASSTLTGGASIPGPSTFKLSRPPNNTTLISALQMTVRGLKTDAGTASIQQTYIGALGGTLSGSVHNLSVAPNYFQDIIEKDPDSGNSITPTTIVNGQYQINRTA